VCGWRVCSIRADLEGVHESTRSEGVGHAMVGHSHSLVDGGQGCTADET
jgi:hypothetical protein